MKKIMSMFILILFFSCLAFAEEKKAIEKERTDIVNAKKELERLKKAERENKIYYGEGLAEIIGGDLQKAKELARKNATAELSGKIKTKVQAEVNIFAQEKEGQFTTETKRNVSQKVMAYTEAVLENLEISDSFMDYPKNNYMTIFVSIDKEKYDEKVQQDLFDKIDMIRKIIISADKNFERKSFVLAIKDYISASELLEANFSGIPIIDKLYPDKDKVHFNLYINNKLSAILPNIQISTLDKNFVYDADGKVISSSKIYVQYSNENKKENISGVPLKAEFISGEGLSETIKSNEYGEVNLELSNINPQYTETIIKIEVDTNKLGLSEEMAKSISLNSLKVVFIRKKTIAVSVSFMNNNSISYPSTLKENLKSKLLTKNYNVIFKDEAKIEELKNQTINADYLIIIELNTIGGGNVGNFKNMFVTHCSGSISLYKLPEFTTEISEPFNQEKGFGNSLSNAGWDAFGKVSSNLLKNFDAFLTKLKGN